MGLKKRNKMKVFTVLLKINKKKPEHISRLFKNNKSKF